MSFLEGIYIPRRDVRRLESNVSPRDVAQVLIDEYKCKGVEPPQDSSGVVELATRLTALDSNEVGRLLVDRNYVWHLEEWPLGALRITRMYPPQNDPYNLHQLVLEAKKRFGAFAEKLAQHPQIINTDSGFLPHLDRDKLPIFCIRGKWSNHVIDGHHRSTLAVWDGRSSMNCLTAYKV